MCSAGEIVNRLILAVLACGVAWSCDGDAIIPNDPNEAQDSLYETPDDATTQTTTSTDDETSEVVAKRIKVTLAKDECDGTQYLSLMRVQFMGEYFDYVEDVAVVPFSDCSATISFDEIAPKKAELTEIASALDGLMWAMYLPSIYQDVGATLIQTLDESINHIDVIDEKHSVSSLGDGLAYVGISDVLPVYIEGELNSIAESMDLSTGWQLFSRELDTGEFLRLDEDDIRVNNIGETLSFSMTRNIYDPAQENILLEGTTDRIDEGLNVGLRHQAWLSGDENGLAHSSHTFSMDNMAGHWSLEISGVPESDHYLPPQHITDMADFDSCCQQEVQVAVEVPVVYSDDGDGEFTFMDEVDGGVCKDDLMVLVLHFPPPTHIWAAEWFYINEEYPGWVARYGEEGKWWKVLHTKHYDLLNADLDCQITTDWMETDSQ